MKRVKMENGNTGNSIINYEKLLIRQRKTGLTVNVTTLEHLIIEVIISEAAYKILKELNTKRKFSKVYYRKKEYN